MKAMFKLVLGLGLAAVSATAVAQGDSSADATGGFVDAVEASEAVVIRVPVNAQGQEDASRAEIRLFDGEASTNANLEGVFASASAAAAAQPQLSEADLTSDSSTFGWRRWSYNNYYYNYRTYQPSYYYYGNYYNYSYQYSQNYRYGNYGYNYYYYNRCW